MTQAPNTTLQTEHVPWDSLKPHPRNPRNGDTEAIIESVRTNGVYRPIITAADGTILAGHHLWNALGQLGYSTVDIVRTVHDPDSETATRILLADNRTADLGRYDDPLLLDLLAEVNTWDVGLVGTGYDDDAVDALMLAMAEAEVAELDNRNQDGMGGLLSIADLSMDDPETKVHHGQRWQVGRHWLHVVDPHHEWAAYLDDLTDGAILAPYPDVSLTLTDVARETTMVLIQPNKFLAGHLIDKHRAAFPTDTVTHHE